MHVQLRVDVVQVALDGAHAQGQLTGDRLVVLAIASQTQHIELARGQRGRGIDAPPAGGPGPVQLHEGGHLVAEDGPSGFVGQQDVVVALQRNQPRPRYAGGQDARVVERAHPVLSRVQHQSGSVQPGQQLGHVSAHPALAREVCRVGARRDPLQVVEPPHLRLGGVGNHQRGEHPPELRVRPGPADFDHLLVGLVELAVLRAGERHRGGVAAVEQQPGDPLGMPHGIHDGDRTTLGHAHEREPVVPRRLHDRLEVADACLQAVVLDVPVGQAMPALVVAHDRGELAELSEEVPPHRALPVELQVAEPARRDDQRRAGPVDRVGNPHPVGGPAEPDGLRR